jgi:hypothetical protein
MEDDIMFGRRSSERGWRWRAGVAGATVSLVVLLAALAGAPRRAGGHGDSAVLQDDPRRVAPDALDRLDIDNIHIKADACYGDPAKI